MKKLNSGFSLDELMIVCAGLAIIAVVGMQISKSQNQTSAKGMFDSDVLLTTNEINSILSDPNKCFTTLGGKNAQSTTSGINSINNSKYYSVAGGSASSSGYGNSNLQIQSYALSATNADIGANNSYLLINYQNKNILKGSSGVPTIQKKVNLYVEVDGGSNITKCRSLASSSTDIWSRGSGSDIYYSGNVGAGTNSPSQALDVNGNINISSGKQVAWGGSSNYKMVSDNSSYLSFYTANSERLRIDSSGNIGIGQTSPGSKLDVSGDVRASGVMYTTSLQYTSDKRFKKNIAPLNNSLEKILQLRGVQFDWKNNNKHDVGFIAQETKKQIPAIVKEGPDGKYLTVDYAKIVPYLVEAIKEQQNIIEKQSKEIEGLKKAISDSGE